jgi:hypothetical protein
MEIITEEHWNKLMSLAKSGNDEAQWEIGYYHECGAVDSSGNVLAKVSSSEALQWYTLSATQGNASAQCSLSSLLSSGAGIARNYQAAIKWAKKAISQGNASAAFNLGTIYRDLKKPAISFRWYRQATAMGDNDSFLNVGLCHLFGFGTKQDCDAAHDCFKAIIDGPAAASCQRTKENAYYWMAIIHLMGISKAPKSVLKARKMLEIANIDDDHEQANEILNIIGKTEYLSA